MIEERNKPWKEAEDNAIVFTWANKIDGEVPGWNKVEEETTNDNNIAEWAMQIIDTRINTGEVIQMRNLPPCLQKSCRLFLPIASLARSLTLSLHSLN